MGETNVSLDLLHKLFPGFQDPELAIIMNAIPSLISEIKLAEIHGVNNMPSGPLPLDEIIDQHPFLTEENGRLSEGLSPLAQLRENLAVIMSARQQGGQRLSSDN